MGAVEYYPNVLPSAPTTAADLLSDDSNGPKASVDEPSNNSDVNQSIAPGYSWLRHLSLYGGITLAFGGFLTWLIAVATNECTDISMDVYTQANFTKTQCNLNCSQSLQFDQLTSKWNYNYCELKWDAPNATVCGWRVNNVPTSLRLETRHDKNLIRSGTCYTTDDCVKIYCSKQDVVTMKVLTGVLVLAWTLVPLLMCLLPCCLCKQRKKTPTASSSTVSVVEV